MVAINVCGKQQFFRRDKEKQGNCPQKWCWEGKRKINKISAFNRKPCEINSSISDEKGSPRFLLGDMC
jgi:hypothetical protein